MKTASMWASNDMLALWVRLGDRAIERYADRTGDVFVVHDRELLELTGRGRADVARTSLQSLADLTPISVQPDGDLWRITFPNFATKQGFGHRNGAQTVPSASASSSSTEEKTGTPPGRPDVPAPNPGPAKKRKPKTPPPAEAIKIAECLRTWIQKTDPEARVPDDLTAWARVADRMIRLDSRKPDEVCVAIEWLFTTNRESGYPFVVLSMKTLRDKYDRMRTAGKREIEEGNGKRNKRGPAAAARERLQRKYGARTPAGNPSG